METMFFVTLKKVLAWHKNCIVLVIEANYSFARVFHGEKRSRFFFMDAEYF